MDIGFGVFVVDEENTDEDGLTPVVPTEKLNSHEVLQDGVIACPKPARCKYILFHVFFSFIFKLIF